MQLSNVLVFACVFPGSMIFPLAPSGSLALRYVPENDEGIINNPEGVKENSPGRKPWGKKEHHTKRSPERATEITATAFCRPSGAGGGGV